MSILDFQPYKFPIPASSGWKLFFDVDEARAFIGPRENVTAFLIPRKSRRYIIVTFQTGFRVFDRDGKPVLNFNKKTRELAGRIPPKTAIDVFVSDEKATVIDILYYHDKDIRRQRLETRLGFWWYLPEEYRNRVFFNETNSDKLNGDIFSNLFSKIIFKPDFVSYPRVSSRRKVYNWLEMKKPITSENETLAPVRPSGNLSNLLLRRQSPRGFTRSETITP